MGLYYNPTIITDGLVLALDAANQKSYPGSGTTWSDLSANGNNGTLTNGPTFSSSNQGSIVFDGTNDYVVCASSSSFAFGTGDFTLEMWINHGTSGSSYTHLFSLPDQNTFSLKAYDAGTLGELYFYTPSFDTYTTIPTATTNDWTLDRNTWNHIVFLRRSSVAYGYKNGSLKGSKTAFTNNFTAQTLNIGWGFGAEYRSKNIALARIYNRALTANEIYQNFAAGRGRYGI